MNITEYNITNNDVDLVYWLWLTNLDGIGGAKIRYLLDTFDNIINIYRSTATDLHILHYLNETDIVSLLNKDTSFAERTILQCQRQNIKILHYEDKIYPQKLLDIEDFPHIIYFRGQEESLNHRPAIAIIGSREFSSYGSAMAKKFSSELARIGMVIVSGMARGIDSIAHQSAIQVNGSTIAVLGCGIDVIYPPENKELQEQIENSGGVISEYPPGQTPMRENFPRRNRIISGMSDGVLVVECKKRSGTSITVEHALRQGVDVHTLPTNIGNKYGEGNLQLLKNGAMLVTDTLDIISEYMSDKCEILKHIILSESQIDENQINIQFDSQKTHNKKDMTNKIDNLPEKEQQVYNVIYSSDYNVGTSINHIIENIDFPISEINTILTLLQIKNLIIELPGKHYKIS